jgi:hypothetical protein
VCRGGGGLQAQLQTFVDRFNVSTCMADIAVGEPEGLLLTSAVWLVGPYEL